LTIFDRECPLEEACSFDHWGNNLSTCQASNPNKVTGKRLTMPTRTDNALAFFAALLSGDF
jgi:hypothetical protein